MAESVWVWLKNALGSEGTRGGLMKRWFSSLELGLARRGLARVGSAWSGWARRSSARPGPTRLGLFGLGSVRPSPTRLGPGSAH